MKINTLTTWPYIHCCLFDLSCWCEFHLYGTPMRIHYKQRIWNIPGLLAWSNRKSKKIWDSSVAVELPHHHCDMANPDCAANAFYEKPENRRLP